MNWGGYNDTDGSVHAHKKFKTMSNPPASVIHEHELQREIICSSQFETERSEQPKERIRILINKNPSLPLPDPITYEKKKIDDINIRKRLEEQRRIWGTDAHQPLDPDRNIPKINISFHEKKYLHREIMEHDSDKYTMSYQDYSQPIELGRY